MHYMFFYVHVINYIYILPLFPRENYMPTLGLAAYANTQPTRSCWRPAIASTCQRTSRPTSNAVGITYQRPCRSPLVGFGWGWGWLGLEEMGWGKQKRMVSVGGKWWSYKLQAKTRNFGKKIEVSRMPARGQILSFRSGFLKSPSKMFHVILGDKIASCSNL